MAKNSLRTGAGINIRDTDYLEKTTSVGPSIYADYSRRINRWFAAGANFHYDLGIYDRIALGNKIGMGLREMFRRLMYFGVDLHDCNYDEKDKIVPRVCRVGRLNGICCSFRSDSVREVHDRGCNGMGAAGPTVVGIDLMRWIALWGYRMKKRHACKV